MELLGTVMLSTSFATAHRQSIAGLRNDYDVLVLDINLPDAVGWNVLTALDAAARRPRTIVLSAVPPSAARVREFSPVSVLEKPFPIDALLRLIERPAEAGQSDLPDSRREQHPVNDIFMILLIVGAFALMIGYVAGCDRL